ncbi:MAG: hypothetical protein GXO03_04310 [Aquificae bacterium]|nr:hypothetical protein [Aquificota bacterium]
MSFWREVEAFLRSFALREGLTEEEFRFVERELKRYAPKSFKGVHPVYGEPYHSTTTGPVAEALGKFLGPSRLLEKAKKYDELTLLEVGFGLGHNAVITAAELLKVNPRLRINYYALDLSPPPYREPLPPPYDGLQRKILSALPEVELNGLRLKLITGDARKTIKSLSIKADAVFHDGFSPFRNPELWSLEFLALVKERLKDDGYWVSYSSSLAVRRALLELGFKVGSGVKAGRKRPSTVASLKGEVPPLEPEEKEKLLSSPYATPIRDPTLSAGPLELLARYFLEVFKKGAR